jgi:hypothetical protein
MTRITRTTATTDLIASADDERRTAVYRVRRDRQVFTR